METIKVAEIIKSKSAISPRLGLIMYDLVVEKIKNGHNLSIDFGGIEDLTSAFCNSFIGKLYMNLGTSKIENLICFSGIEQNNIWERKIKNSILLGSNENLRNLHNSSIDEILINL